MRPSDMLLQGLAQILIALQRIAEPFLRHPLLDKLPLTEDFLHTLLLVSKTDSVHPLLCHRRNGMKFIRDFMDCVGTFLPNLPLHRPILFARLALALKHVVFQSVIKSGVPV